MIISQYFRIERKAIAGVDYDIPGLNFTADGHLIHYNFTISPGEKRCFKVIIIDDNVAELQYKVFSYDMGVYNPDQVYYYNGVFQIEDNEGNLVYYSDISAQGIYYFQRKRHFDGLRIPAFNS